MISQIEKESGFSQVLTEDVNSCNEKNECVNVAVNILHSTYLTSAATEVIQTEYMMRQSQWLSETLKFKNHLKQFFPSVPLCDSPILPIIIGDSNKTLRLAAQLAEQHHIFVGEIRPPSVPKGTSRLRLSLHCNVAFDSLAQTLEMFFTSRQ